MEPRRHGEMVGGSGACARVLAKASRVCGYRLVDAIASCSRSVGGSAARRLCPGAMPPTLRRCTRPDVAGAHVAAKCFVPPKSLPLLLVGTRHRAHQHDSAPRESSLCVCMGDRLYKWRWTRVQEETYARACDA